MNVILDKFLRLNKWGYYLFLCVVSVLFAFLVNNFLYSDDLYYKSLEERLNLDQIQNIIHYTKTWKNIGYVVIPLIIIIRILYTSFCFSIGNFVQELHWDFKSLFNISLKADIIFCLSIIANFYYYSLTENYNTVEDLGVNCFSLLRYIGRENIPGWLMMALNSMNIFEILYITMLALLIQSKFRISYLKSTVFVLLTYCIGNYFYIVGMTFIYLNFS